jgi:hypothetical protein
MRITTPADRSTVSTVSAEPAICASALIKNGTEGARPSQAATDPDSRRPQRGANPVGGILKELVSDAG